METAREGGSLEVTIDFVMVTFAYLKKVSPLIQQSPMSFNTSMISRYLKVDELTYGRLVPWKKA